MNKPLIVTFYDLSNALAELHVWHKPDVDRLHDIWMAGAPTPDSIIRNPKHYDPRNRQPGNHEKRIVFPTALLTWVMDVTQRRGMPVSARQALHLLGGQADYGLDQTRNDQQERA